MILLDTDTISLLAAGHARVAARFVSSTEPVATTIFTRIEILRDVSTFCSKRRMETNFDGRNIGSNRANETWHDSASSRSTRTPQPSSTDCDATRSSAKSAGSIC